MDRVRIGHIQWSGRPAGKPARPWSQDMLSVMGFKFSFGELNDAF